MVRQADDSFVCFGAKPDKGFWTRDLGWPEVGKGTPEEGWTKELEEGVGEGWREWPVDIGQQRDETAWVSPVPVRKTGQDRLAFLVACGSFASNPR